MNHFPAAQPSPNPATYTGSVNPQALNIGRNDTSSLEAAKAELRKVPVGKRNREWQKQYTGLTSQIIMKNKGT